MNARHNPYTCGICHRIDEQSVDEAEAAGGSILWLAALLIAIAALFVLALMGADAKATVPSAGAAVWSGVELIGRVLA